MPHFKTTDPGMWRIDLVDGVSSDMVNLSRAKDAAVRLADGNQRSNSRPDTTAAEVGLHLLQP